MVLITPNTWLETGCSKLLLRLTSYLSFDITRWDLELHSWASRFFKRRRECGGRLLRLTYSSKSFSFTSLDTTLMQSSSDSQSCFFDFRVSSSILSNQDSSLLLLKSLQNLLNMLNWESLPSLSSMVLYLLYFRRESSASHCFQGRFSSGLIGGRCSSYRFCRALWRISIHLIFILVYDRLSPIGRIHNNTLIQMGISPLTSRTQPFEYYSNAVEPNTGPVEVYTCKSLPMAYIMKIKHTNYDSQLVNIFRSVQQAQSVYLVTMFECKEDDGCKCNGVVQDKMVSFWEYYVLYFEELLRRRGLSGNRFSQQELWHLVKVCLQGYKVLRSRNVYYDFDSEKLIITPESKAKLFWSHVRAKNAHLRYFQECDHRTQNWKTWFSPEELRELRLGNFNVAMNFEKCNMFSFGMLLLYAMTLKNPIRFYNTKNYEIDSRTLIHEARHLTTLYSDSLLSLLQTCLAVEPSGRKGVVQLIQIYGKNFQPDSHFNYSLSKALTEKSTPTQIKMHRISLKRAK